MIHLDAGSAAAKEKRIIPTVHGYNQITLHSIPFLKSRAAKSRRPLPANAPKTKEPKIRLNGMAAPDSGSIQNGSTPVIKIRNQLLKLPALPLFFRHQYPDKIKCGKDQGHNRIPCIHPLTAPMIRSIRQSARITMASISKRATSCPKRPGSPQRASARRRSMKVR